MVEATTCFEQTEIINAPPGDVYLALADPAKHSDFTGAEATGEPVSGGVFTAWNGYIEGRFLAVEPGHRIFQEWRTSEWPEDQPPSQVEWVLETLGNGDTRLVLSHSGVPSSQVESYRAGWVEYYWKPLKRYFERD